MTVTERQEGDVTILDLQGSLTLSPGVCEFRDTVHRLLVQGHRQILLNYHLCYIDSAGLGELIKSWVNVRHHGGTMRIAGLTRGFPGIHVVTKLLVVFENYDDEETALASFRQDRP